MNIFLYLYIYIYIYYPLVVQVEALQSPDIDGIQERYKKLPRDWERGIFQGWISNVVRERTKCARRTST